MSTRPGHVQKGCFVSLFPSGGPLLYSDVKFVYNSQQLNGTQRVLLDNVISEEQCRELHRVASVSGNALGRDVTAPRAGSLMPSPAVWFVRAEFYPFMGRLWVCSFLLGNANDVVMLVVSGQTFSAPVAPAKQLFLHLTWCSKHAARQRVQRESSLPHVVHSTRGYRCTSTMLVELSNPSVTGSGEEHLGKNIPLQLLLSWGTSSPLTHVPVFPGRG